MPSPRHLTNAGPSEFTHSSRTRDDRSAVSAAVLQPPAVVFRLRKHADYQRVYAASRKQFGKQMSYFFMLRPSTDSHVAKPPIDSLAPRVGLTVGKVMGKAVDRNRIKRRMREAVRRNLALLRLPVDVVLHPRRSVIDLDFALLEREIATVFRAIQRSAEQLALSAPPAEK